MDIRDESYYKIAKEGSLAKAHPSFLLINQYGESAKRILDIGCGEGTRLSLIKNNSAEKIGVDESYVAVALAKKQYPALKFTRTQNRLPFSDSDFDFVYSAFVLEHTKDPELFLKEAVRVLVPGGKLLLVAPNFGAPNRASPNNRSERIKKLFGGFKYDMMLSEHTKIESLNWQKVIPQKKYTGIDADTTVEPYLLTLEKYLNNLGLRKLESSSLWNQEEKMRIPQIIFNILGQLKVYPFLYWGPHLLYVGEKT